ncbi:MAG: response regulator [Candidatus Dormibacteraeota bacterium]|nr:response regulator [Candidatus Dormibacteraeota bacterium]
MTPDEGDEPGERLRLLLVEDDPEVAAMYQLRLELDGYLVELASDGEAALRKASERPPDLIFLDIRLPGMGGLELLEALRSTEATRLLPVVILTAFDEPELRSRGARLGALDYLIKSQHTPGEIASSILRWVEDRASRGA